MSTPTRHTPTDEPITIGSPEFVADPHRFYDRIRRETPV